jgi:hypothetical protein
MTKIISMERQEKDGLVIWERELRDEVWGRITQRLTIKPGEKATMQSWMDRHYWESRLERVVLSRPVQWKGRTVDVVLTYTRGSEGEGNNNWRSVDIVPHNLQDIDALLHKIVDFDTYSNIVACLRETCKQMSYFNTVECDISPCIQQDTRQTP